MQMATTTLLARNFSRSVLISVHFEEVEHKISFSIPRSHCLFLVFSKLMLSHLHHSKDLQNSPASVHHLVRFAYDRVQISVLARV